MRAREVDDGGLQTRRSLHSPNQSLAPFIFPRRYYDLRGRRRFTALLLEDKSPRLLRFGWMLLSLRHGCVSFGTRVDRRSRRQARKMGREAIPDVLSSTRTTRRKIPRKLRSSKEALDQTLSRSLPKQLPPSRHSRRRIKARHALSGCLVYCRAGAICFVCVWSRRTDTPPYLAGPRRRTQA